MYPSLIDIYVGALQCEREKEVLRLSEEARLLRDVKAVVTSRPKLNLNKLLTIFNKEKVRQGKIAPISLQSSADCCLIGQTVQCQSC
jgi:hypothetical protein